MDLPQLGLATARAWHSLGLAQPGQPPAEQLEEAQHGNHGLRPHGLRPHGCDVMVATSWWATSWFADQPQPPQPEEGHQQPEEEDRQLRCQLAPARSTSMADHAREPRARAEAAGD